MQCHPEDASALQDLAGSLLTNPHSGHAAWGSDASALEREAEARALTLAMCNAPAEEYECIFTSGATGRCLAKPPLPDAWAQDLASCWMGRCCTAAAGERVPMLILAQR